MTIIQKTDETDDEDTQTEGAANSTLAAQQLYYQRLIWNWGGKFFNSHSSLGILPIFIFTLFVTTSCEKSLDASVRQKVVSKHKN